MRDHPAATGIKDSVPSRSQEIRNIHNEELMGIRREEEMEMSDDDMEDAPDSKDSDDSGMHCSRLTVCKQKMGIFPKAV